MPVNRLVALLTPFFSAGAAIGSAWLLKHFPGLPVPSQGELTGVEVTVATGAAAAALKWLHGHQAWERRVDAVAHHAAVAAAVAQRVDPSAAATAKALYDHAVSDAEEFAHQPQVTPADSPRPESSVTPDPVPATAAEALQTPPPPAAPAGA